MDTTGWITEDERRVLLDEQDLLERVADLATVPGRIDRSALDVALRTPRVHRAGRGPAPPCARAAPPSALRGLTSPPGAVPVAASSRRGPRPRGRWSEARPRRRLPPWQTPPRRELAPLRSCRAAVATVQDRGRDPALAPGGRGGPARGRRRRLGPRAPRRQRPPPARPHLLRPRRPRPRRQPARVGGRRARRAGRPRARRRAPWPRSTGATAEQAGRRPAPGPGQARRPAGRGPAGRLRGRLRPARRRRGGRGRRAPPGGPWPPGATDAGRAVRRRRPGQGPAAGDPGPRPAHPGPACSPPAVGRRRAARPVRRHLAQDHLGRAGPRRRRSSPSGSRPTTAWPPARSASSCRSRCRRRCSAPTGPRPWPPACRPGAGRVEGLHYGTYDFSAALGVGPLDQALDHPLADHAKAVMQLAAAQTGVRVSDGSTNVLPVGTGRAGPGRARPARPAGRPGRRPGRCGRAGTCTPASSSPGTRRRSSPCAPSSTPARPGCGPTPRAPRTPRAPQVLDEPATAQALAAAVLRGVDCGAVDLDEARRRAPAARRSSCSATPAGPRPCPPGRARREPRRRRGRGLGRGGRPARRGRPAGRLGADVPDPYDGRPLDLLLRARRAVVQGTEGRPVADGVVVGVRDGRVVLLEGYDAEDLPEAPRARRARRGRGAPARAGRQPRPRQRARPHPLGGLPHRHPGRGRGRHDDRSSTCRSTACRRPPRSSALRTKQDAARGDVVRRRRVLGRGGPGEPRRPRPACTRPGCSGSRRSSSHSGVPEFGHLDEHPAARGGRARSPRWARCSSSTPRTPTSWPPPPPPTGRVVRGLPGQPARRGRGPRGRAAAAARRTPPAPGSTSSTCPARRRCRCSPQARAAGHAG